MRDRNVVVIAPKYYGLDESIGRAFERHGYGRISLNLNMQTWEKVLGKMTRMYGITKTVLNRFLLMGLKRENREYVSIIRKSRPSFVFIVKGDGVLPQTLHILNRLGIACISYQWDDPFYSGEGTTAGDEYRTRNFKEGMSRYNHIFVFDRHYVDAMKEMGVQGVSYLPLAADDEVYRNALLTEEERVRYGYDVSFVGMPFQNRIQLFNELEHVRVGVFGDYWDRHRDEMKGDYYRGKASGEVVKKIYCASKINLNINHPQSRYGVNTRTFEIPACRAFSMVDYKHGVEDLFDIHEEIVCYRDTDELKSKIRYYLKHDGERLKIAEKGYERVLKEHTWWHRMRVVVDSVKN